jgi:hypothetical protein
MKSFFYLALAGIAVANDNHKTFSQIAFENGY